MNSYFTTRDWISLLRGLPSPEGDFLTVTSLVKLTGLRPAAVRQACWRNQRAGLLRRVGPNLYANLLKNPSGEHLAVILFAPAYLSLEWALSYHGLIQRVPPTVTCVTTGRPRRVKTFLGEIAYVHIAPRLFFGFEKRRTTSGAETFLAYPEKALLDWVYYRQLKGQELPWDEFDLSGLELTRLRRWAERFPPAVGTSLELALRVARPRGRRLGPSPPTKKTRGILKRMSRTGLREKQDRI